MLLDFIASRMKLNPEKEDYYAYGSLLMNAGVALKQNFSGTGYNENVRYVQDFSAKLFLMEEAESEMQAESEVQAESEMQAETGPMTGNDSRPEGEKLPQDESQPEAEEHASNSKEGNNPDDRTQQESK